MPKVISRKQWGAARPKNSPVYVVWHKGGTVWVHHTEGTELAANTAIQNEYNVMRSIQSFHQNTRGWSDIGYSYVIFPSGRIYEGRGRQVQAAHCPGHNSEPGIAFAGSFDDHTPTQAAWDSLGAIAGQIGMSKYKGHRDGYSTSCPGNALYNKMKNSPPVPSKKEPAPKTNTKPLAQRLSLAGLGKKSIDAVLKALGRKK